MKPLPQAFIIRRTGNEEMDEICLNVRKPAVTACGLEPKRVDKSGISGIDAPFGFFQIADDAIETAALGASSVWV